MFWERYSRSQIQSKIFEALGKNISYRNCDVIGFPGSVLDREVFHDAAFVRESAFLSCMLENPNHIGVHTLDTSERVFEGTQALEQDLIKICGSEILGAPDNSIDGYVSPGGTESNIQALWIFRNLFQKEYGAKSQEIGLLYSEDTHYSLPKGGNLLGLKSFVLPVDPVSRQIKLSVLEDKIKEAKELGIKFFCVTLNMGTTMFGSVDEIHPLVEILNKHKLCFRIHVDAAFGGFIYPFTNPDNALNFANKNISSITLDAHKMLQAPYGTGIFLARKGLLDYVLTSEAQYVEGQDYTLCGSRSGANAISVWMILRTYGSEGGKEFLKNIAARTDRFCHQLDNKGIKYFRDPFMNIVTISSKHITPSVAGRYMLVPDSHNNDAEWWKVVVMDHVPKETLDRFVAELS